MNSKSLSKWGGGIFSITAYYEQPIGSLKGEISGPF